MDKCPHCNQSISLAESSVVEPASDNWTSVARIANVAEAGYLANRLQAEGLAARVVEAPSFNAAGGDWSQRYVLQVDAVDREAAVEILRTEAHEADSEFEYDSSRLAAAAGVLNGYRVVGLLALAGFAGFWAGGLRAPLASQASENSARKLAEHIEAVGSPLQAIDPQTGNQHRIGYDDATDAIILQHKAAGDDWRNAHLFPLGDLR